MTYTDERVAAEMGRVLLALYRAGMQVRAVAGRAERARRRADRGGPVREAAPAPAPRSASGAGDSPLQAIYAAVERMNERAGAIVVPLD